jgi:hypothetical protein
VAGTAEDANELIAANLAEMSGKQLGSEWDPMRRLAQTLMSLAEPEPE